MDRFARLLVLMLLSAAMPIVGCHETVHDAKTYDRTSQYDGLNNHSIAVIVDMSDRAEYRYPDARRQIAREVARRLTTNLTDVQIVDPDVIIAWQAGNPYWTARRPSQIIEALNVERVVLIEIGQYSMTDAGDTNVKRGVISGNIHVIESDAIDTDNYGFTQTLRLAFPDEFRTRIGLIGDVDIENIRKITVSRFTEDAAGLFYDHSILR